MYDNEKDNEEEGIKIVLVGEAGVGKTSIIDKYYHNSFSNDYMSSSTASLTIKEITINKKKLLFRIHVRCSPQPTNSRLSSQHHVET